VRVLRTLPSYSTGHAGFLLSGAAGAGESCGLTRLIQRGSFTKLCAVPLERESPADSPVLFNGEALRNFEMCRWRDSNPQPFP